MLFRGSIMFLLYLKVLSSSSTDITFHNVKCHFYDSDGNEFKKTIASSNKLIDYLPESGIDKIEFEYQEIPTIYENAFSNLKDLDELLIQNCAVHEIKPGGFNNISFVRRMSLKGNKIEDIKQGVFNNLNIGMLDLSRNLIKTIEAGALNHMPKLLDIDLSDNKIAKYDKNWFEDTPVLNMVSFKNNSITLLSDGALANLKGNKKIGNDEVYLNIVFSYNKISNIEPKAFQGLSTIHLLLLDNNELTDFSEVLLENVNVDMLSIELNKIQCLSGDLAKVFKAKETFMDGNPFDCKCLETIETFVKNNKKEVNFIMADLKCFTKKMAQHMHNIGMQLKKIAASSEEE